MQSQSTTKGNLSWADIEGCATYSYDHRGVVPKKPEAKDRRSQTKCRSYDRPRTEFAAPEQSSESKVPSALPYTAPRIREAKTTENRLRRISSRQCYTCKPRGKVLKHIINGSDTGNVIFHFDLHKRPLILVTTKKHYESFYEIPHNEVMELFTSIKTFCDFWAIKDYGISYNNGAWQTHPHFHIKIKTNEKIINRLRRDHFALLTLNTNYSPSS